MTEPVKRYNLWMVDYDGRERDPLKEEDERGDWVTSEDYARLEQECERLRADLRFLAEYITAKSVGNPLPNYLAIGRFPLDVARAALSAKTCAPTK